MTKAAAQGALPTSGNLYLTKTGAMVRQAQVLFKGVRAGLLLETAAGGSQFVYDPDWTQDIGCCLPVSSGAHSWPAGLHPFFQHLGAEGWLRERQARQGQVADQDDLGLLLRYGAAIGLPERAARRALTDLATRTAASRHLVPPGAEDADGFVHRYAEIVHAACTRRRP